MKPETIKSVLDVAKEIGRWAVFLVISAFVTQTLAQINLVPEIAEIKVFMLTYTIPIRSMLFWSLTVGQRLVDRYMYNADITSPIYKLIKPLLPSQLKADTVAESPKGLLNF